MDKVLDKAPVQVIKCIEVTPNQLIEIGQRLRSAAMDRAQLGQSVIIPLTADIALIYNPEREFCRPNQKPAESSRFLQLD